MIFFLKTSDCCTWNKILTFSSWSKKPCMSWLRLSHLHPSPAILSHLSLPQTLCTGCAPCQQCNSIQSSQSSHTWLFFIIRTQLQCHLGREAFTNYTTWRPSYLHPTLIFFFTTTIYSASQDLVCCLYSSCCCPKLSQKGKDFISLVPTGLSTWLALEDFLNEQIPCPSKELRWGSMFQEKNTKCKLVPHNEVTPGHGELWYRECTGTWYLPHVNVMKRITITFLSLRQPFLSLPVPESFSRRTPINKKSRL